jgi:hypothetical protein
LTATSVARADEGRAVDRRQHQVAAADLDIARGVAGMLGEARGRRGAEGTRKPAGDMHPFAAHIGPGLAPEGQRAGILHEIDPDLLQHGLCIMLDDLDRLGIEHLEIGDCAGDVAGRLDADGRPLGTARRAPAAPLAPPCARLCRIRHRAAPCPVMPCT